MARYVDGFVFAVPKSNRKAYIKMAKEGAAAWKKFGAVEYMECRADDVNAKHVKFTFPKMARAKASEEVWFSFIVFKSKSHRDSVNKKVMAYFDKQYKDQKMPEIFDMARMAYGGFTTEVQA